MKKFLLVTLTMLLALTNVSAQSKKELKAQAKIQQEIDETTNKHGSRFFRTKLEHIRFYASPIFEYEDGTVILEMLIQNRSNQDESLTIYGNGSEYTYNTFAKDSAERYYSSNRFTFAFGGFDNFEGRCKNIFVPAMGLLKMRMKIANVDSAIEKFTELNFGYRATLEKTPINRKATLKELPRNPEK